MFFFHELFEDMFPFIHFNGVTNSQFVTNPGDWVKGANDIISNKTQSFKNKCETWAVQRGPQEHFTTVGCINKQHFTSAKRSMNISHRKGQLMLT